MAVGIDDDVAVAVAVVDKSIRTAVDRPGSMGQE